ncbi:hypothetical protein K4K60_012800 [Colletotrichum sp. SAR11_57]|nr:hypothetical protein K4K60_012800 [Colletotrichum sp. SAR11_57]
MASASPTSDSTAARERGNAFYRKGQFTEAEKAYKEAASLAPEDPAPWSNISAIKFEQGDYAGSLKNLEKALSLSSAEPENGPKKQKLYTRMAKCHLHSLSLSKASQAVEALSDDASGKDLRASFKEMESLWSSALDAHKSWENIVDRLPRYKGSLQDAPEYYAFGHDQAEPLFDAPLWPLMSGKDPVSFLFCGSGDARHLFVTIVALFVNKTVASVGGPAKGMASAPAHFTLVDINAAALARTLIIFDMTFRYGVMKAQKLPHIEDALMVLAYMYSSAFIPKFVAEKILEHVRTLIDHFEDTEDGVGTDYMFMLYIPKETRIQVLRKLKQWTEPLGAMNATKRLRPGRTTEYI